MSRTAGPMRLFTAFATGASPTVVSTDRRAGLPPLDLLVGKLLRAFCHASERSFRRTFRGCVPFFSASPRVVGSIRVNRAVLSVYGAGPRQLFHRMKLATACRLVTAFARV